MKLSSSAVWVVITSIKLTVMAGWIIAPVVHVMRADLGVGPVSAGLIITTHALFTALFYPPAKIIVSKIGVKKALGFGLLLYGVSGGSGLVINTYWLLLISRVLLGIGYALTLTPLTAVLNLYEEEEVEKMMGVSKDTKAFGSINWPVFGGFLGIFSWHLPFAVYLFAIPLGLVVLISVPEIYRKSKDTRKQDTELMKEDYPLTGASFHEKYLLLVVYGLTFLTNILLFTILIFLPQLLEGTWISFPFFISLFFIAVMISGAVTSSKYQKIRSALSNKMVIPTALGLWAAGFAAISQTYSSLIILASVVLFGIGEGLITPAVATWVDNTIPLSYCSKVKSRMGTIRYLGQFSAPVVFFPVVVLEGLPGVFLAAAGVCAVLFLLFLAGGKE